MKKIFFVIIASFAITTICHAQANTKLSNLVSPTAVNVNLIPGGGTGTKDLGSNTKRWRNGYFNATVYGYGVGSSYGIYGTAASYGVYGTTSGGYGVYGSSSTGYGVVGSSGYIGTYGGGSSYGLYGSGGTYGAYASGSSYGVYGSSSSGYGVAGVSSSGYGVYGSSSSSWGAVAYGVYGVYGSGTSGYGVEGVSSSSYGVYGYSGSNWAVYGTGYIGTYGDGSYTGAWGNGGSYGGVFYGGPYGVYASGTSYAGYFSGNVYASGVYSGSDKSLKKNITEFNSAMDMLNKLKPRQYEYRHDGKYDQMNLPVGNHYGLVAQDVELVLPNLVKETRFETNLKKPVAAKSGINNKPAPEDASSVVAPDSDASPETINFKAVNYIELIPIIIKAMQELSQQNDDLKTQVATLTQTVNQLSKSTGVISAGNAALNQNFPNPFTKSTVISFSVPQGSSANIIVSQTGSGKVIKTIPLSAGAAQFTFDGASLAAGSYSYSLYIDGRKVDTKQMVINR